MLCKDRKQHHVMCQERYSISSLLCIAQNVRFEIPYKVLYFETPFLMYSNIMLGCPVKTVDNFTVKWYPTAIT